MSSVLAAIAKHAASHPGRFAILTQGHQKTYGELPGEIDRISNVLQGLTGGAQSRRPIGVALDNGPAWALIDLALIKLGRPSVPLPPFFSQTQAQNALADAGAGFLIRAAAPGEGGFSLGGALLAIHPLNFPERELHPGTAKITYTSGSTGAPKGVCLSQQQMETVASDLVEVIGADFADRHLAVLPLGVLLENVAGLYPVLLAGGTYQASALASLGFQPGTRPDMGVLVKAIERSETTSLILVPELLSGITTWLRFNGTRLSRLRLVAVGGAKVSERLIAAAREQGLPAYEGYGLSECGSVVALNTPSVDRPGTVGRVLPHRKVSFAPDGEILIEPDTFLGYVGQPAKTGQLRTGDLGALDADGCLRITGRKSNLMITSFGRNVAPEWVESELLAQPEIAQAAVFGDGAPELCALVVPLRADLIGPALDAAVTRANATLPDYAQVKRWRACGPFDAAAGEVTQNGRPRRDVLHEAHRPFIDARS